MEEYENHPSQKPEALLERIIKASSNEARYCIRSSFQEHLVLVQFKKVNLEVYRYRIQEDSLIWFKTIGFSKLEF